MTVVCSKMSVLKCNMFNVLLDDTRNWSAILNMSQQRWFQFRAPLSTKKKHCPAHSSSTVQPLVIICAQVPKYKILKYTPHSTHFSIEREFCLSSYDSAAWRNLICNFACVLPPYLGIRCVSCVAHNPWAGCRGGSWPAGWRILGQILAHQWGKALKDALET